MQIRIEEGQKKLKDNVLIELLKEKIRYKVIRKYLYWRTSVREEKVLYLLTFFV
jgi:hypothetical protein